MNPLLADQELRPARLSVDPSRSASAPAGASGRLSLVMAQQPAEALANDDILRPKALHSLGRM